MLRSLGKRLDRTSAERGPEGGKAVAGVGSGAPGAAVIGVNMGDLMYAGDCSGVGRGTSRGRKGTIKFSWVARDALNLLASLSHEYQFSR